MRLRFPAACAAFFIALSVLHSVNAAEVTVLYTGSTHGMIYPCDCPKESDGGIARRAALVKELRKKYPDLLLLDAGNFFAGGALDEYARNAQLDMQRSVVNLKAMDLMDYDAAAIQDAEFYFGRDFLQKNIASLKTAFLSSSLELEGLKPYVLKDAGGVKVGVIGAASPAIAAKTEGARITEPKKAVGSAVAELRSEGAAVIILLSGLGIEADKELAKSVPGIDVVISSGMIGREGLLDQRGDTLFLAPSWQGRKLSLLKLSVENGKAASSTIESIRLSDQIKDDPDVNRIRPKCFSDTDCKMAGKVGLCIDPGKNTARCSFSAPNKIRLLVVSARDCRVCDTSGMPDMLKRDFPGLEVSYLYYPDASAKKLLKELSIEAVPAYLFGKEIEKEAKFSGLGSILERKGDYYAVKPEFSGFSYLLERKKIQGRFDLFVSLFDKHTAGVLETTREFSPRVHFLAVRQNGYFSAAHGKLEVEEDLRAACARKLYPEHFWDYIICRAKNPDTSWWEDCAAGMDIAAIKACARGDEGAGLLMEDISLNRELSIMLGPAYLLDNVEIFSTNGVPGKEELKKLIPR